MGRKGLKRNLVLTVISALAFMAVMAFPSAHAQSWGDPQSMFVAGIPLIVGLGVGAVYWAIISARRSR